MAVSEARRSMGVDSVELVVTKQHLRALQMRPPKGTARICDEDFRQVPVQ